MIAAVFLAASCGAYMPQPCLVDPAQYGHRRTEQGCRAAAWARGWDGGPINCVTVRLPR